MRHEVQVKGELRRAQLLEQSEHEPAVRGRDEVIRVLDARGDALQIDERADGVAFQPGGEFLGGDARKDGHDGAAITGAPARAAADIRTGGSPKAGPARRDRGSRSSSPAVAQVLDQ